MAAGAMNAILLFAGVSQPSELTKQDFDAWEEAIRADERERLGLGESPRARRAPRGFDQDRLEFLWAMLHTGDWVAMSSIQSAIHHRFGDPGYKPEMDYLRQEGIIDLRDVPQGTQHRYFYRMRPDLPRAMRAKTGG